MPHGRAGLDGGLAHGACAARSSASRASPATARARSPASSPAPWRPPARRRARSPASRSPRRRKLSIAAGVGRIPEDRHREGIVGALSIAENLALETLRGRLPALRFLRDAARRRMPAAIARLRRALSRARRADPPALGRQHPEGDPGARARARAARPAGRPADARPRRRRDRRRPPPPARGARARRGHRADLRGSRRAACAVRPHRRHASRPALGARSPLESVTVRASSA